MDIGAFVGTQIFTIVGLVCIIISFVIHMRHKATKERRCNHTRGLVIENKKHWDYLNETSHIRGYFPVVSFSGPDGTMIKAESQYGTGRVTYEDGSTVDVWYDPKNPKDFHLDNFSSFGIGPVAILSGIGFLFLVVGVGFGYLAVIGVLK